jgi:GMP synthase (glutamine-hydrolysing)
VDEPRRQGHRAAAGFKVIASNESTARWPPWPMKARKFYGVQFHPEVTHTIKGKEMIARFVHDICGCQHDWNMPDYVEEAIEEGPRPGG